MYLGGRLGEGAREGVRAREEGHLAQFASKRKRGLVLRNSPLALAERVEAELVGDLSGVHCVRQILLVGEDEQHGVAELILFGSEGEDAPVSDEAEAAWKPVV